MKECLRAEAVAVAILRENLEKLSASGSLQESVPEAIHFEEKSKEHLLAAN